MQPDPAAAPRGASNPWREKFDDKVQELSGAFLFGVPLLYTLEMWSIGKYGDLWKLALFLFLALGVCMLLSHFARPLDHRGLRGSLEHAIEAVATGLLVSLIVLVVLNRIDPGDSLDSILGMVVIQAVPLSIGASAGSSLLAFGESRNRQGDEDERNPGLRRSTLNDVGATLVGAVFLGLPLAPGDEIGKLAAEMRYWHELALFALTLLVTYAIVFESGFNPRAGALADTGLFRRPASETMMAYIVALLISLLCLYLFNRIEITDPPSRILSATLLLSLPTALGGAAGRLVL